MQNQRIVIVAEKVRTKEGRAYKLLDLRATKEKKLPSEYFVGRPYVYLTRNNQLRVAAQGEFPHTYSPGDILTPGEFQSLVKVAKAAGDRLHAIRKEIKKELEGWEGIHTEVI